MLGGALGVGKRFNPRRWLQEQYREQEQVDRARTRLSQESVPAARKLATDFRSRTAAIHRAVAKALRARAGLEKTSLLPTGLRRSGPHDRHRRGG